MPRTITLELTLDELAQLREWGEHMSATGDWVEEDGALATKLEEVHAAGLVQSSDMDKLTSEREPGLPPRIG